MAGAPKVLAMAAILLWAAVSVHAQAEAGNVPAAESGPAAGGGAAADSAALDLPMKTVKGTKAENASVEVKSDFIRRIPSTMNDPIRSVSFAPGVTVQNDLNIRPYVRGGDADQTQVVMNGISLLQPYHMGGVFSLFNLNTVESIELYRDDFPVEYPGALSGVLRLKAKRPSLTETRAGANLSLVRGDAFAETPVIKDRLSVYGAAQSFLFNRSLHAMLDLTSGFSQDEAYQQDIQGYRDHINLPDFQDYHWGSTLFAGERVRADYQGGLSKDAYTVVVPAPMNIVRPPSSRPSGQSVQVVELVPRKEIGRAKKLSIDSISAVDIGNQTHFLNLSWDLDSDHHLENAFGFQTQRFGVEFKKAAAAAEPLSLSLSSRLFDYRLMDTWSPLPDHRFKLGFGYGYKEQEYRAEMPYVLYDVIMNSNMDMLETLGNFSGDGFSIDKEDSARSNFDYLGEYPSRIRFSHEGRLEETFASVFYSHAIRTASGSFTYGFRGEFQSTSGEFVPGPRVAYKWKVGEADELLFTSGLYSQNALPFYERDRNPFLKAEKSGQAGARWNHAFGQGYRMAVDGYYKRYFDLVAPSLAAYRSIDLDGLMLPLPESDLSAEEIAGLKAVLDTVKDFASLPDSVREAAYETFGDLAFDYRNTGTGNSLGAEFSFFYAPTAIWDGWISADFSLSDRRDAEGGKSYPYRYHRPIVLNWVNYFDMPGKYDISFTYRWALGQPYTPYSGTFDGKGSTEPISVGARNSGRLTPYSRLDIRLTRNAQWRGTRFKGYLEVWNSMNSPNYFARDNSSGQLKSAQLNWPFPLFFLGISAEL